jgi:hypothetical protein
MRCRPRWNLRAKDGDTKVRHLTRRETGTQEAKTSVAVKEAGLEALQFSPRYVTQRFDSLGGNCVVARPAEAGGRVRRGTGPSL